MEQDLQDLNVVRTSPYDPAILRAAVELAGIRRELADLKERQDELTAQLRRALEEKDVDKGTFWIGPVPVVKVRVTERTGLDTKRLAAEQPDIAAHYQRTTTTRTVVTHQILAEGIAPRGPQEVWLTGPARGTWDAEQGNRDRERGVVPAVDWLA